MVLCSVLYSTVLSIYIRVQVFYQFSKHCVILSGCFAWGVGGAYGLPGPPFAVMVTCGHASHWMGILLITPSSFVPGGIRIHTTAHSLFPCDGGAELGGRSEEGGEWEWWIPRYLLRLRTRRKGVSLMRGADSRFPHKPVRRVTVPYLHGSRRRGVRREHVGSAQVDDDRVRTWACRQVMWHHEHVRRYLRYRYSMR